MALHLVTDSSSRLSYLRSILEPWHPINPVMLNGGSIESGKFEAVIIAVDLRVVENISALKELIPKIENARKRIFVIEQKSRLLIVQAYALGATRVFSGPVHPPNLLAALANHETANATFDECLFGVEEAASAGVTAFASMFASVLDGKPVDVERVEIAASKIADRIADDGLSRWLSRRPLRREYIRHRSDTDHFRYLCGTHPGSTVQTTHAAEAGVRDHVWNAWKIGEAASKCL